MKKNISKHKLNDMKKLVALISITALLAACGASTQKDGTLAEKQRQLKELREQQTKTSEEITKLEKEIGKLDPSATIIEKPKLVGLKTLGNQEFVHYIDLQGKVDAENISYVNPRGMGGLVKELYVKRGDIVKKGQLLMKLDDAVQRQQLQTAKTQLEYAKNLYQRQKNLWDQNIGTEIQLINAKNNVDQVEHNVALINEQISMSNVYAEVGGIADEVTIRVGENFNGNPAQGIKIVNTASLKVVTDIPENYLSRVKQGTPVLITIPDLNKKIEARVTLISQSIGLTSRGFMVESKIPYDPSMKPNMVALVKILDYTSKDAISIPVSTIQTDEKGKFVLVATKEGNRMVAKKKPVVVGELYGDAIEIKSGLAVGDSLISEGFQGIYEGQALTTTP